MSSCDCGARFRSGVHLAGCPELSMSGEPLRGTQQEAGGAPGVERAVCTSCQGVIVRDRADFFARNVWRHVARPDREHQATPDRGAKDVDAQPSGESKSGESAARTKRVEAARRAEVLRQQNAATNTDLWRDR